MKDNAQRHDREAVMADPPDPEARGSEAHGIEYKRAVEVLAEADAACRQHFGEPFGYVRAIPPSGSSR